MTLLLLLSMLIAPAPPVYLQAQWDSDSSASVSWHQTARGCLYKTGATGESAFIGCYEKFPASYVVTFGAAGPLDAAYRPVSGDIYKLVTGGQTHRAPLRGRDVYLAVWRG